MTKRNRRYEPPADEIDRFYIRLQRRCRTKPLPPAPTPAELDALDRELAAIDASRQLKLAYGPLCDVCGLPIYQGARCADCEKGSEGCSATIDK